MFYWFSPFILSQTIRQEIANVGGLFCDNFSEVSGTKKLFIFYLAPHELLDQFETLAQDYVKIRELSSLGNIQNYHRLIYSLSSTAINDSAYCADESFPFTLPQPEPLEALVTLALLKESPAILDAYIDLEMRADLVHASPDTAYLQRLRHVTGAKNVITSLNCLRDPFPIIEAREEAERTMLDLHTIQEELQLIHLADRDNVERIRLADFEVSRLGDELSSLGRELEDMRAQCKSLSLSNESRDSKISLLNSENSNLRDELFNRQQILAQALQEVHEYKEKLHCISVDLSSRDQDLAALLLQLQNSQNELQALRLEDNSKLELIHSGNLEVARLSTELESSILQLNAERNELGLIRFNYHNLEIAIDLLRRENEHLSKELHKRQHQLSLSLKDVDEYKTNFHHVTEELDNRDRLLISVRENADLTLLQLHQMQEELEEVFKDCQAQRLLIDAQKVQLERAARLFQGFGFHKGLPVLPKQMSIQVLALLEGYRHSLKRAERLLGGF